MDMERKAAWGLVGGIILLSAIALAATLLVPSGWAIWALVAPLDLILVAALTAVISERGSKE